MHACHYTDCILASGEITVASPSALDRETTPTMMIRLTATDNGGTRLASTVPITVVLTNINDFSPVFSLPSYSISVPEVLYCNTLEVTLLHDLPFFFTLRILKLECQ